MNPPRALSPKTLKAARIAQSLSLSGLTGRCGISAPTLSRLESGEREATADEVASLAGALGLPAAALCRPLVTEQLGLSGFYHRKISRAGAKAVRAIESRCVLDAAPLRDLFDMVGPPGNDGLLSIDLDDAKGSPEMAAHMFRLKWQVPRGTIPDLFALVEAAGCVVIHTDFGVPKVDALYQKAPGLPPIFWVNSTKPLDRVRCSVAHELGHLVLHEDSPVECDRAEREADAFAAAFLMPRSDFRAECPGRLGVEQLIELKRRWRCSMAALARNAHHVGRITEQQYTNLMIALSKRGWRTCEPFGLTPETPTLLARTIRQCLQELEISEEGLADRLAISLGQLKSWRQPFPGGRPDPQSNEPALRFACGF